MDIDKHNLDITMYSFQDLLNLFTIKSSIISTDDIKNAKRKVLMMHPDKSKLDSKYFLFYKKALDVIYHYYSETHKQNQSMSEENTEYKNVVVTEKDMENNIKKNIKEMSPDKFQSWFNEQFEEIIDNKTDSTRNEWFTNHDPVYKVNENVKLDSIGKEFEQIKKQNADIIKYKGVENFGQNFGSKLYDDNDIESSDYISSDPFSKLQYDDLRKVHKDQTIFAVGENDLTNVKIYNSMEQLQMEREGQNLEPINKEEALQTLEENEKQYTKNILKKQFESNRKTDTFEEKNKSILSSFLRLF